MKLTLVIGLAAILVSCKSSDEAPKPAAEKEPAHPWEWTPTDPAPLAGKEVYLTECSGCHNEGEEGAPSLIDAESWKKRTAKGIDTLYDHALNGYDGPDGEMPARGGTPSLSDTQVKNAVQFMVNAPK